MGAAFHQARLKFLEREGIDLDGVVLSGFGLVEKGRLVFRDNPDLYALGDQVSDLLIGQLLLLHGRA